jgi:hypothetical protein
MKRTSQEVLHHFKFLSCKHPKLYFDILLVNLDYKKTSRQNEMSFCGKLRTIRALKLSHISTKGKRFLLYIFFCKILFRCRKAYTTVSVNFFFCFVIRTKFDNFNET